MGEKETTKLTRYYTEFEERTQHPGVRALHFLFMPVLFFAVMGLIWMIPFPEIGFLKKHGYDIFLNWGSFYIAIVVYYYLRLSPVLSYAILLSIGVMSFLIVQLEYWEAAGGLPVWAVCALLLVLSLGILWFSADKSGGKAYRVGSFIRLHVHGPLWLWHLVFDRFNIRH